MPFPLLPSRLAAVTMAGMFIYIREISEKFLKWASILSSCSEFGADISSVVLWSPVPKYSSINNRESLT